MTINEQVEKLANALMDTMERAFAETDPVISVLACISVAMRMSLVMSRTPDEARAMFDAALDDLFAQVEDSGVPH